MSTKPPLPIQNKNKISLLSNVDINCRCLRFARTRTEKTDNAQKRISDNTEESASEDEKSVSILHCSPIVFFTIANNKTHKRLACAASTCIALHCCVKPSFHCYEMQSRDRNFTQKSQSVTGIFYSQPSEFHLCVSCWWWRSTFGFGS